MRSQSDISRLAAFGEEGFEASHLVASMIAADPSARPRALQVLSHPYFWDAGKRLAFLQDVSDRIEVIDREKDRMQAQAGAGGGGGGGGGAGAAAAGEEQPQESEFIRHLEERARDVTGGGDWTKKVDKAFMDDLGKWRKYSGGSVRDLLRALRNKVSARVTSPTPAAAVSLTAPISSPLLSSPLLLARSLARSLAAPTAPPRNTTTKICPPRCAARWGPSPRGSSRTLRAASPSSSCTCTPSWRRRTSYGPRRVSGSISRLLRMIESSPGPPNQHSKAQGRGSPVTPRHNTRRNPEPLCPALTSYLRLVSPL